MLREVCGVSAVGLLGWLLIGADSGYSRIVDRPPTEVAAAIADLDIRDAPGSPGTDPLASGGELPTFSVEAAADRVSYVVMAQGRVAIRMTAWLEPVDGGRRTKVTASVERGPAPDDYVSPAFRSTGITLGLFSAMLEDEIDDLVFRIGPWGPHCDAVMARFEMRNLANGGMHQPTSLTEAVAGTAKAVMSISALDKELKSIGCPPNANGDAPRGEDGFTTVRNEMGGGPAAPVYNDRSDRGPAAPTTDLSKYR